MKVLVIGSGAREHAITWKLSQSPRVTKLFCAPGNPGMSKHAECIDIKVEDIHGLLDFALQNHIDLTVVGPEAPLVLGIVDVFEQNGLRIFGPNKQGAQLEGSKTFSKAFMEKYQIPTARYKSYSDIKQAIAELHEFSLPLVIKADGLAAGKGVFIVQNRQEAVDAIYSMMGENKFGEAGKAIVVEEFLNGKEVSIMAFVDENTVVPMVSAQDYKRALDEDQGQNTGGMGAVSPAFYYTKEAEEQVRTNIINKTIEALKKENICYKGVLYFGLMLTAEGPKVLEFNARFGDPETEVVLPRLKTDLVDIIAAAIDGKLEKQPIEWADQSTVCVVMASGGYPEKYNTGCEISGVTSAEEGAAVFHAGTKLAEGKLVTAGGRVLVLSALGENHADAREKAYEAAKKINFSKAHYRSDIGRK